MERAAVSSAVPPAVSFRDGLGERRQVTDPTGSEALESLCLRPELASVPAFEFALRERVSRLAGFRHESYARVRSVERLSGGAATLAVVSEATRGVRLSDMLALAAERGLAVDINTALCLIRQLVPAIAHLHETAADVAHGAIAPERLVVTPDARVIVVEHTLGAALEQLRFSRDRYWRELRIALPSGTELPRFDRRVDVTQLGAVAIALILGRPLRDDEFPSRIGDVVASTWAVSARGGFEPLPPGLRGWLGRTLQLDPKTAFGSAVEARVELDKVLGDTDHATLSASLEGFLARYQELEPAASLTSLDVRIASVLPTPKGNDLSVPPAPPDAAPIGVETSRSSVPSSPPAGSVQRGRSQPIPVLTPALEPDDAGADQVQSRRRLLQLLAGAAALVVLVGGGAFVGQRYFMSSSEVATGTLVITTNPAGTSAVVDGEPRGMTPLTLALPPGEHVLELQGDGEPRRIPITISAGGQVSQYIELTKSSPVSGQIQVRSTPPGARVTVDGVPQGVTPALVAGLQPGEHEVVLDSDLGPVKQLVTVEAGITASLLVPMAAPQGAPPVPGWVSVEAPIELKLFEGDRLLGSSLSDRIMVPTGRHEIDLTSETFGYRASRVVQVAAGKVATIKVDLPQGALALNAVPWAEVWIDGERVGETPIGNVPLAIGSHDIVFRHPELGEQHQTANVALKGVTRVSADLRKR